MRRFLPFRARRDIRLTASDAVGGGAGTATGSYPSGSAGTGFYPVGEARTPAWALEDDDWLAGRPTPSQPAPPPSTPPSRNRRRLIVRPIAGAILLLFVVIGWLAITAPLNKSLEPIVPPQITLLASDGTPIARMGAVIDDPIEAEQLPPHVVEAFLAIEDRRFYNHWGIDPRGIARAAITGVGGGSTITQQLAKFTFLTPERSLTRKGREMLIAFWLEAWLTKEQILERYLSNAYFGDNVYGLRAASLHYFYRQPERLTLSQATMLAGLVQAPSRYAPTKHYSRAEKRRRMVVAAMVDAGYLSEREASRLRSPTLDVREGDNLPTGTYFADWALPQARAATGNGYARRTLTTTLDARLQEAARIAVRRASLGNAQVALVAMRRNGEVVAMLGGRDYARSPFNRVTQARRQPGSTFKLFVYLAALREGWEPDDRINNQPIVTGQYRPRNAGGRYSDTISLADAFAQSSNVATVRLMQEVGSDEVIETARSLGITAPLDRGDPTMALGTSTMTLLELTAAYAGVAANSFPVAPRAFAQPERTWWQRIVNRPDSLSGSDHRAMLAMLRQAINRGTGRAAALPVANFGKTGTTQNYRDALFVGFAGDLVVGVWIGNDDNTPLAGVTGGGLPARIWRDFMSSALRLAPERRRAAPTASPNPSGPVEPQDVPSLEDIPFGPDGAGRRVGSDGVAITTDVDGRPVEVGIGREGVILEGGAVDEQRRRAAEEIRAARREAEARRRELEEQLRAAEEALASPPQ